MPRSTDNQSAERSLMFMEDDAAAYVEKISDTAASNYPGHEDTFVATVIQKLNHAARKRQTTA